MQLSWCNWRVALSRSVIRWGGTSGMPRSLWHAFSKSLVAISIFNCNLVQCQLGNWFGHAVNCSLFQSGYVSRSRLSFHLCSGSQHVSPFLISLSYCHMALDCVKCWPICEIVAFAARTLWSRRFPHCVVMLLKLWLFRDFVLPRWCVPYQSYGWYNAIIFSIRFNSS